MGFSDLSAFFKYVVYLFKDLAKRIRTAFLPVPSQALIIPGFDLLAVDLELNSLPLMWVAAFKKKSLFKLADFKIFFFCMNSLDGERKEGANYSLFVLLGC